MDKRRLPHLVKSVRRKKRRKRRIYIEKTDRYFIDVFISIHSFFFFFVTKVLYYDSTYTVEIGVECASMEMAFVL